MPYKYLFPSALLFIAVGVYSTNSSLFEVGEVLAFGVADSILALLDFPVAPILLGFVLGPMVEENFRRSLLLSHGDLTVFIIHPISAVFVAVSAVLVLMQVYLGWRTGRRQAAGPVSAVLTTED